MSCQVIEKYRCYLLCQNQLLKISDTWDDPRIPLMGTDCWFRKVLVGRGRGQRVVCYFEGYDLTDSQSGSGRTCEW